ncbi:MAG: NAD(P)H-hydrate dehydratase [Phycisphaeraceae bacterium]|nr:NAD(P)H-hydrate dehydratase [Phycisphaeraceae bacterium]
MSDSSDVVDAPLPDAPARPADSHKGTYGTVIVVGGCTTMIGAPALAARAALRTGTGLVKVAVDPAIVAAVITIEPGATAVDLTGGDLSAALDTADPDGKAVLAVGPGLGGADAATEKVKAALAGDRPVVLDADGLNQLAGLGREALSGSGPRILTPHPGEYRRLAQALGLEGNATDPAGRPAAAAELARACEAVVVLKGHRTVISDGETTTLNETGNPALAVAGTGDVLTGCIAGLLAQGLEPLDAARLGVWAHGEAGDQWGAEHGPAGLRASELADRLPAALHRRR